jgi:hypothetical protein
MLLDDAEVTRGDPILAMVAMVNNHEAQAMRVCQGIYLIGHFGSSGWLQDYEHYPEDLPVGPYGVCDSIEQLLEKCPELEGSTRGFLVTFHVLEKKAMDPRGGWRWHKWGEYIGTQDPQCEYLYDEPEIEKVYVYHIYERK